MTNPVPATPLPPTDSKPPGVVTAAAVTVITAAALSGMLVLFAAVAYGLIGRTILPYFADTDSIVAWFIAVISALLITCLMAIAASVSLLRRRRWGWWTLLVLSPVTAIAGVMAGYYVLPLIVAGAAVAVFVLLLLRSTRAWLTPPVERQAL